MKRFIVVAVLLLVAAFAVVSYSSSVARENDTAGVVDVEQSGADVQIAIFDVGESSPAVSEKRESLSDIEVVLAAGQTYQFYEQYIEKKQSQETRNYMQSESVAPERNRPILCFNDL